jgi:hypothetical protein
MRFFFFCRAQAPLNILNYSRVTGDLPSIWQSATCLHFPKPALAQIYFLKLRYQVEGDYTLAY